MEKGFICGACNMVFPSTELLEKHKAHLCIGRESAHFQVSRHNSEMVIRHNAEAAELKKTRTPDLVQLKGQRGNIIRWKSVDSEPARVEDKATTSQIDGAALKTLTDEVQQNRTNLHPSHHDRSCGRQLGHSERLKAMREMAERHEHQLALIHAHNQQLEQQRDELAQQVNVLTEQSSVKHLESLLKELRQQEERTEETLQQLTEHLQAIHVQEVSVPVDQPDPRTDQKMHHSNSNLVSSVDGPLSAQIKALRQAYLQSGGSDPAIVAQMIDLQAEAQSLEKSPPSVAPLARRRKKGKPPRWDLSCKLLAVEQNNQRLEEEIIRIQVARERRHNHMKPYGAVRSELELLQRENLQHITSLQAKMEREEQLHRMYRHQPPHLQNKTHPPFSLLQARSSSSSLGRSVMEPVDLLGPTPYDPAAGFLVFYDLVLRVDASQRVLRLTAAIYSEGQAVEAPTLLPPVQCLPGESASYAQRLTTGNYALLSFKQPVPRIQPSPSLSLVVEVQAAGNPDVYNQEGFKLVSCGWTQLELFDQYNQLRSGHWRAPIRSLPIRPYLSLAQLNSVPQVGSMELCLRLVNSRDGDMQTLIKPDPSSTSHYKYPAVVSSLPVIVHGNGSVSAPCGSQDCDLSSLLTPHDQDPPPTPGSQR
ncbi:coiled-coil domain-containing protein 17 [Sphaeramia orbicularis]|uniref:coiled-coil domain-containing protein 17 n=1 Tax=Sphaeramia orbicularis TaxID=375764 RepID=UPI00118106D1|nr:coiled-coil domain-containing protein 17 [Sphaeramia orbicularis]